MSQQTLERGRYELRAIIGGIFDHVLNKEKETAILNTSRMERPTENMVDPIVKTVFSKS